MAASAAGMPRRPCSPQRSLVVEGHIATDNLSELCLDVRIQLVVLDAVWGGKFPEAQKGDIRARGSAAHLSRAMVVPSSLSQSSSMPSSVYSPQPSWLMPQSWLPSKLHKGSGQTYQRACLYGDRACLYGGAIRRRTSGQLWRSACP